MNKTLAFLESLGSNAELAADSCGLRSAAEAAELPLELVEAVANRDRSRLETLLGASNNLICAVFPVQPDSDQPAEEEPEQEPAQEPATDHDALSVAA